MPQDTATDFDRLESFEDPQKRLDRRAYTLAHERAHAEFPAEARASQSGKCSSAIARRTIGDRDSVRRARPRRGTRPSGKGDGDPDPAGIARDLVSFIQAAAPLLVAPLTRLLATPPAALVAALAQLSAPRAVDPWSDQGDWPFRPRVGMRLWRERRARGDDRVAVRGRVHYMRQSLIDEILRGAPQPKKAPNKAPPEAHLSPLEKVERELDLIFAEAAE